MLHGANNVGFQQDGVTAHTSRRAVAILREMFQGHLISLRGGTGWPPVHLILIRVNFSSGDISSQRDCIIALNLLNNLKMQFVKKLLPFHLK